MHRFTIFFLVSLSCALSLLSACKPVQAPKTNSSQPQQKIESESDMATLTGEIWYRERIMLSDNIRLEVYLEDVSKMDVAATVIASAQYDNPGMQPWPFELEYDPNLLHDKGRYTIRARVMEDGRLRFINTQLVEAFNGKQQPLRVLVQAVAAPEVESKASDGDASTQSPEKHVDENPAKEVIGKDAAKLSPLPLTSSQWLLEEMNGRQMKIQVSDSQSNLMIDDQEQRIAGNSGCNLFNGSYQVNGNKLSIGPLISTRMACQESIMNAEQAYLSALQNVHSFQHDEKTLVLLDTNGKALLRFKKK